MDLIQSILLGILQGITEFLPVSSSGHLALARALIGKNLQPGITFEIVVHFGSFCSIVIYYRKMIGQIISDFFRSVSPEGLKSGRYKSDPNTLLIFFILLSMLPAMIVGFTLKDPIEELFLNPFFVSVMLIVTGILLFSTRFVKNLDKELNGWRAIIMGVAQSLAVLPGISRAGSTISTGLYFGLNRNIAATFSFLMVLPVLAGAMILEIKDVLEVGLSSVALGGLLAGFLSSFISGYLALSYLIKLLKREKFHYFAYYCWAVGVAGAIYFA